jgi:hypothetical protein
MRIGPAYINVAVLRLIPVADSDRLKVVWRVIAGAACQCKDRQSDLPVFDN